MIPQGKRMLPVEAMSMVRASKTAILDLVMNMLVNTRSEAV